MKAGARSAGKMRKPRSLNNSIKTRGDIEWAALWGFRRNADDNAYGNSGDNSLDEYPRCLFAG